MQTRMFALALGVVYVVLGILGFISPLCTSPPANAPHLDVTSSYAYLFGVFPENVVTNVLNILVGLAGIIAGTRLVLARYYLQFVFLLFGMFTFMGFVPTLDTLWGVLPLFTGDTWLHAGTCILAGYFAWVAPESTHVEPAHGLAH